MKWQRGTRNDDVVDIRGQKASRGPASAAKLGGGGAILVVVIGLIASALGVNIPGLGGGGGGGGGGLGGLGGAGAQAQGGGGTPSQPVPPSGPDPDAEMVDFIRFVMKDIQDTFVRKFAEAGQTYQNAKLYIFTDAVDTQCGFTSAQVGPFYCPPDASAYIDLSFYRDLRSRFGAPGDFAQAYVLAHEIGHHIQNLLGTDDKVRARSRGQGKAAQNELSVRQELQADCYAGVWASAAGDKQLLDVDDIQEAVRAAQAIGDDRLQKQAGVPVDAETWTHGSSEQRVRWFTTGFQSGQLAVCDTFAARSL
ncbi:MAG: neutral zinc metallopeptidase [Kofleriaceae bacterium]|jgi:predicted metalloprotease|nr:neutral zinc metallopeptidase [Kofleriaceae bacterium]MBP6841385.1 neutral zinc metallopeptidase [Kofleriaceae bacterium]MBP9203918.1 neutral zinc metallopeptidase [Kofleriaceae bacterium]